MMQTKLTSMLGIKYPIILGAMAWITESKLVSAVSNAGATGVIASGGREVNWVKEEIKKTRSLTKKPFGVNIVLLDKSIDEMVDLVCREKVDFVTLGAGNPVPHINKLKSADIKVIPVVPNLKLAKRVADNGADAVIVEGMEAGGHIGNLSTMAHMTNIIPEIDIPVIIAGGIADGRGIAAAILMGAEGVQMGSRFLLAKECHVHDNFKNKIIEAKDIDSIVTGYTTGHGVRGLKNTFTEKYLNKEFSGATPKELHDISFGTNKKAVFDGDVENGFVLVGQSLIPLKKVQAAEEIVNELMLETQNTFKQAAKYL